MRHKGFTLIEVLVVVALIAILAAIAIPNYSDYLIRSRIVEATSTLSDARVRMEQHFQDNRCYRALPCATSTVCAFTIPNGKYFTFACAETNGGLNYVWTATGAAGAMNGFAYTVNHANVKASTIAAPAPVSWRGVAANCWITQKGGC